MAKNQLEHERDLRRKELAAQCAILAKQRSNADLLWALAITLEQQADRLVDATGHAPSWMVPAAAWLRGCAAGTLAVVHDIEDDDIPF